MLNINIFLQYKYLKNNKTFFNLKSLYVYKYKIFFVEKFYLMPIIKKNNFNISTFFIYKLSNITSNNILIIIIKKLIISLSLTNFFKYCKNI